MRKFNPDNPPNQEKQLRTVRHGGSAWRKCGKQDAYVECFDGFYVQHTTQLRSEIRAVITSLRRQFLGVKNPNPSVIPF